MISLHFLQILNWFTPAKISVSLEFRKCREILEFLTRILDFYVQKIVNISYFSIKNKKSRKVFISSSYLKLFFCFGFLTKTKNLLYRALNATNSEIES